MQFQKHEYVDMKTITAKRIKTLKNLSFHRLDGDNRHIVEEESSLEISEITDSDENI